MSDMGFLFLAYFLIWTILFLYLFSIGKKLTKLEREIEQIRGERKVNS